VTRRAFRGIFNAETYIQQFLLHLQCWIYTHPEFGEMKWISIRADVDNPLEQAPLGKYPQHSTHNI
jgi:hypothetical protein